MMTAMQRIKGDPQQKESREMDPMAPPHDHILK